MRAQFKKSGIPQKYTKHESKQDCISKINQKLTLIILEKNYSDIQQQQWKHPPASSTQSSSYYNQEKYYAHNQYPSSSSSSAVSSSYHPKYKKKALRDDYSNPGKNYDNYYSKKDQGFKRQNWGKCQRHISQNQKTNENQYISSSASFPHQKLTQDSFISSLQSLQHQKQINQEIQSNIIASSNPLYITDYSLLLTKLLKYLCQKQRFQSITYLLQNIVCGKLKHKFKQLQYQQIEDLFDELFHFMRTMNQRQTQINAALRFVGHICFANPLTKSQLTHLLEVLDSQKILSNKFFTKLSQTPRLSVNLLTNILMRKGTGVQMENKDVTLVFDFIFLWFQFLCENQTHFSGEIFVKNMMTSLRAVSFILQEVKSLDDVKAASLFINLHKFLFIGTELAEKVFSKRTCRQTAQIKSIMSDSSQISASQKVGGNYATEEEKNKDPFLKMRTFALHSLQNIFKLNCKIIFNHYWYLLLPSFIIRSSTAPIEFQQIKFASRFEQQLRNEPTLVSMIMREKSLKIRISATVAISTLLQNSPISKWLGPLEKNNQGKVIVKYDKPLTTSQTAITPLSQTLGLIVRFMHYILIFLIQRQRSKIDYLYREYGNITDYSQFHLISQLVKLAGTLIQVTPYVKMIEGLLSLILVPHISELLLFYDDQYLKAAAIHCFACALGVNRGVHEEIVSCLNLVKDEEVQGSESKQVQETKKSSNKGCGVINYIITQCPSENYKSRTGKGIIAVERGIFLSKLAKNYGKQMISYWRQISSLIDASIEQRGYGFGGPDKKKLQFFILKMLQDWLRQQSASLLVSAHQQSNAGTNIDNQKNNIGSSNSPQKNKNIALLSPATMEEYPQDDDLLLSSSFIRQKSQTQAQPTTTTNLPVFSLPGFKQRFIKIVSTHFRQNNKLLPSIEHQSIIINCLSYLGPQQWNSLPPILIDQIINKCLESNDKSQMLYVSIIKLLGCMACLPIFTKKANFLPRLIQKITSAKLTQTNTNVYIRVSWTLANTCAMLRDIDSNPLLEEKQSNQDIVLQHYVQLLNTATQYIKSQKQKSSANGIRSLRFLLKNSPLQKLQQHINIQEIITLLYDMVGAKQAKISQNSCVALTQVIYNPSVTLQIEEVLYKEDNLMKLADVIQDRDNFKTRIHAIHTIKSISQIEKFGDGCKLLFIIWEKAVYGSLNSQNVILEYFSERKYLTTLKRQIIELIHHFVMLVKNEIFEVKNEEVINNFSQFISANARKIIDCIVEYLQKALRITEKRYEKAEDDETTQLAATVQQEKEEAKTEEEEEEENQQFEIEKQYGNSIEMIQDICKQIKNIANNEEEIMIPFSIYEKFNEIAESNSMKDMRNLECLTINSAKFLFDQTAT